jgi:ATPase subunit of ABC transporter with duplicated ATPase domains
VLRAIDRHRSLESALVSSVVSSVVLSDVSFAWPDGTAVFDGLSLAIGAGRSGLIGLNGSGKSTLLRLIAGELPPARGSIIVTGSLGYLPQHVTLDASLRVDEVLGIAAVREALRAIEGGSVQEHHFAIVGDDWDADERARAELDRLGLSHVSLDRRIGELSGGESGLLLLGARFLARPDVLLLDEPTNNLDMSARERLSAAVESWPGSIVLVSHDRALLERVDQIGELRGGDLRWFGGTFADYEEAVTLQQDVAERAVRSAESDVRRQKRELAAARVTLDRRVRYGQKKYDTKREPKIIMNARKREAQVSAGKYRTLHIERLDDAQERLTAAAEAIRDDNEIIIDLPATSVPARRTVLTLKRVRPVFGPVTDLIVRGPERIALVGPNGAGKTTLLRTIVGELAPLAGTVDVSVPVRYLPQRLDRLDNALTIVENVSLVAPTATDLEIRSRLARFLFRGTRASQPAGTLSGGERFRAALAALLLAEPPPQLLLLDEPTNNLDLASVRQLASALAAYQGALIVASHDRPFLEEIGITRWLTLDRNEP